MSQTDSTVAPVSTSNPMALNERWEEIVTDERNRWTDSDGDEELG